MTVIPLGEYRPWLYKVANRLLSPGHPDLDDLVQEGYIAMWKAEKSFSPEKGKMDWWLKFKAHRRMLTIVQRRRLEEDLSLNKKVRVNNHGGTEESLELQDLLAAPDLLESIEMAYHTGEIAEAIDSLSPAQRKYVYARFWLGLSGKEMQDLGVFGYDPSALWTRKSNGARDKLGKELAHLHP